MGRMRALAVLAAIVLTPCSLGGAEAQDVIWARQFGTAGGDFVGGLCGDVEGVYVVGQVRGSLPGQTLAGESDAFIRRYSLDGEELWTRQFGTAEHDFALDVCADATGAYVVGTTQGALPGQASAGNTDAFVRKYDAQGTELWTRQFGNAEEDVAQAVCADATGICVVGYTHGALPAQTSAGREDAFARKYDPDGEELWTRQFGTPDQDLTRHVAADSGGIYVVGLVQGPREEGERPTRSAARAFVASYSRQGRESWTRYMDGASVEAVCARDGGPYLFGHRTGRVAPLPKAFVSRLQGAGMYWGEMLWLASAGPHVSAFQGAFATQDGIYAVGVWDPHPDWAAVHPALGFVAKYDADGGEAWVRQFEGPEHGCGRGVWADDTGVYVAGHSMGDLPGHEHLGKHDIFVAKLPLGPPPE